MSNAFKLAQFLGANKTRGEQLWIVSQKSNLTPKDLAQITQLTQRIEESYAEIFGSTPNWNTK